MRPNGPAVWLVGVTRRSTELNLYTSARKLSRCKEGMAWFLQIKVQVLSNPGVSRYNSDRSREVIPGYKFGWGHWRSVAVQFRSEPEIYHGSEFW